MGDHALHLTQASLFANGADDSHFVIEVSPVAERRRTRCSIIEWPTGQLEAIERKLATYRMPVIHEGEQSYFWARSKYMMVAIGLALEAFQGMFDFDPPEFWYHIDGEPYQNDAGFRVEDCNPSSHDRVKIECTNWRNETPAGRELFAERLRASGLCIPASVFFENEDDVFDTVFYASLTPDAAHKPLETFPALVQLHPATEGNASAKTA